MATAEQWEILDGAARKLAAGPRTIRVQDEPLGEGVGPYATGLILTRLEKAGVVSGADQKGRRRVLITDPDAAGRAVLAWAVPKP